MTNSELMFAPMSVRLAAQGERDRRERAEKLEAERIEREAAQAREKSREQLDAEFAQNMLATSAEAVAKQQAIERANFDAQARAKAERESELDRLAIGIGDRIADRQMPVLAEILDVLKQLRDSQAAAHQEEV
jgi:hypothetical protein